MRIFVQCLLFMTVAGLMGQETQTTAVDGTVAADQQSVTASGEDYQATLDEVNVLLTRYNAYQSSISINPYARTISFQDKFSVFTAAFEEVEFRRAGENIGIFCKEEGASCLRQEDTESGEFETLMPSYTFGIKENGKAVAQTDQVVQGLNNMLANLTTAQTIGNLNLSDEIKGNLELINGSFRAYNAYNTIFGVKGKQLLWTSRVGNYEVDIAQLSFYVDYTRRYLVLKCIDGVCVGQGDTARNQYSMTLETKAGKIAPDIELVLAAFNNLRKEILQ